GLARQAWLPLEEALQLRQQRGEDVLAAEVGDGALFDLAAVAVGFDDADILIDGAVGGRHLDRAEVHSRSVSRQGQRKARAKVENNGINVVRCVTTIFGLTRPPLAADAEKTWVFRSKYIRDSV